MRPKEAKHVFTTCPCAAPLFEAVEAVEVEFDVEVDDEVVEDFVVELFVPVDVVFEFVELCVLRARLDNAPD